MRARIATVLTVLAALAGLAVEPVSSHQVSSPKQKAPEPSRPRTVVKHEVRNGETLSGIAEKLGVTTRELAQANAISNPNRIRAGRVLTITISWYCPVKGPVRFVDDFAYVKPNGERHGGIDLMARKGTPVVAPVPGRVAASPNNKGGNAFQLFGADGVRYYGSHLDRLTTTGRVRAGTVIGYVGNTGNARGGPDHLHFEAHPGGNTDANPYPTLVGACR